MAVNVSTGYAALILGPNAFDTIFADGVIEVRTGPQPSTADMPPTGQLIARITRDGGEWTPGSPANGLRFARADRFVVTAPGHEWLLSGIAPGVAGWCRLLPNAIDPGTLSTVAPRIDGSVGLVGAEVDAQLWLPTIDITVDTIIKINQWLYAMPPLGE